MINMDYLDYVPVVGFGRFVERTTDESTPFAERVSDAVMTGFVSGYTGIGIMSMVGPSYGMVRVAQGIAAATPVATIASVPIVVSSVLAVGYERAVNRRIRETHYNAPYYGPFAGAFGTVV